MPRCLKCVCGIGCATLVLMLLASTGGADTDSSSESNLIDRKAKQQQVQANTKYLAARVGTMVRVLQYYKFNDRDEMKMLQKIAKTLDGVSRNEMNEVIRHLDVAAKARLDTKKFNESYQKAYNRHREILRKLEALMLQRQAVKTLDQASEFFQDLSKKQLKTFASSSDLIKGYEVYHDHVKSPGDLERKIARYLKKPFNTIIQHQEVEQGDIAKKAQRLVDQVNALEPRLEDEDQKARLKKFREFVQQQKVLQNLQEAASNFDVRGSINRKIEGVKDANRLQDQSVSDLKTIARLLRNESSKEAALREAKQKIQKLLAEQKDLEGETKTAKVKQAEEKAKEPKKADDDGGELKLPGLNPLKGVKRNKLDRKQKAELVKKTLAKLEENAAVSSKLGNKQSELGHEARDVRNLLQPHAKKVANELAPVENAMQKAEAKLRDQKFDKALDPQKQAIAALKNAEKAIDKMLKQTKKNDVDPLASLKNTADKLDQIIKDQKRTRDTTKQATEKKQDYQLPFQAGKQVDLAQQTANLKKQPLPTKNDVTPALNKATKAMSKAAKALLEKKGKQAVGEQTKAVKALEDARKELGKKIAAIEKRRADIAALEKAAEDLKKLTKAEGKVADTAKQIAKKKMPAETQAKDAKDLGQKQQTLTPKTKDVGKEIAQAAPKAAQQVQKAAAKMEKTKGELDKNKPAPAAQKANEAVKDLKKAQAEIAKALNEKKGEEIKDQIAMQKKQVDPFAAAEQLKNALDQTKQAAEKTKQAQTAEAKLAEQQKKIAELAKQMNLPKGKEAANKAADALKQKDFGKAINEQVKALQDFSKAKQDPMAKKVFPKLNPQAAKAKGGEPQKAQQGKAGEAKKGEQPQAQQPKANQAQPAQAKKGQPQPAQAKGNQAKAAQPKAAQQPMGQQPKAGQKKGQPMGQQPKAGQKGNMQPKGQQPGKAKTAQPKTSQAKTGTPKAGQPQAKSKAGESPMTQPKGQSPKGQPKAGQQPAQMKGAPKGQKGQPKGQKGQPMGGKKGAQPKTGQAKTGQPKTGQAKTGQPKGGQKAGQSKAGQAKSGKSKGGMSPMVQKAAQQPAQAKAGQAKAGEGKKGNQQPQAQAKDNQPQAGQQAAKAKSNPTPAAQAKGPQQAQPKQIAMANPMNPQAQAKGAPTPMGQAPMGQAPMGQKSAKGQSPMGQAKSGQSPMGQSPMGQKAEQGKSKGMGQSQSKSSGMGKGSSKGTGKGQSPQPGKGAGPAPKGQGQPKAGQGKGASQQPKAVGPAQLAQQQKKLIDDTQAAAAAAAETKAAMAALGQAQAKAPQTVLPLLEKAGENLGKALDEIAKGDPGIAQQAQQQAMNQMNQAMQALQSAMAGQQPPNLAMNQKPGQSSQSQSQSPGEGTGQGKGMKPGQGKGQQPGPSQEKNEGKGTGERVADGKRSNKSSVLQDIEGAGHFLNLPPRQRELIRQALSGEVSPEYAEMIRQYYANIARGRRGVAPTPTPSDR